MRTSNRARWSWLLVVICASGCIDRARTNVRCEWTGDSVFALDPANPIDRKHLIADAQLAEELAVRHADSRMRHRPIENGRLLHECMANLVAVIERTHGVTAAQIDDARAQRDSRFDVSIMLSFGAIYVAGAAVVGRWLRRRFTDGSRLVRAMMIGAASIACSALGVQLGALWTGVWESVRIGNDHYGTFRAARVPMSQHLDIAFVAGIVLFWIAAALASRSARDDESLVDAVGASHTLLG
jgi:hypothetical protein